MPTITYMYSMLILSLMVILNLKNEIGNKTIFWRLHLNTKNATNNTSQLLHTVAVGLHVYICCILSYIQSSDSGYGCWLQRELCSLWFSNSPILANPKPFIHTPRYDVYSSQLQMDCIKFHQPPCLMINNGKVRTSLSQR